MVEAIRNLRREIDALLSLLRSGSRVYVTNANVLERMQELFLSWSNLRGHLAGLDVSVEVINRVDRLFTGLVRLTVSRTRTQHYTRSLGEIRQALTGQLLLEIARVAEYPPTGRLNLFKQSLIPEIPDFGTELIPNGLLGWKDNIRQFLRDTSFDRNVFVMVAYRQRLAKLVETVRRTLRDLELNAVVAKEHRLTDDLYNPLACLICCKYGVAIFDRGEPGQAHNSNIVYELAVMQTLKRPCVILKHKSLGKNMPSDFLHKLYEEYRTIDDAGEKVTEWWQTISEQS